MRIADLNLFNEYTTASCIKCRYTYLLVKGRLNEKCLSCMPFDEVIKLVKQLNDDCSYNKRVLYSCLFDNAILRQRQKTINSRDIGA